MQFGVKTEFAKSALPGTLTLEKLPAAPKFVLTASNAGANDWRFPYNGATSAMLVNRLLKAGAKVSLTKGDAPYALVNTTPQIWNKSIEGFDIRPDAKNPMRPAALATTLNAPRVAIYQSYDPSMDEGWTRFVLDHYGWDYTKLYNEDIKTGGLRKKYDAIILPDQRANAIMDGLDYKTIVEEYRGGIGEKGWDALHDFVNDGGTLIALGEATALLLDKLPLPVKDLKKTFTRDQHFAPGAIVNLQIDASHPLGRGIKPETWGFYINSPFFQLTEGFSSQKVSIAARYPNSRVNASGWLRGEDLMYGRAAVVAVEMN